MNDKPYDKREIDGLIAGIHAALQRIETQTTATNGKVRRIIIALALTMGLLVGLGIKEVNSVIALLL